MTRLLVATTNAGKVAELTPILEGFGFEVCGLDQHPGLPEAVEDGATFADNARLKASHYARLTGLTALADDSGLEVDALDGAPGVHSARYAGPDADARANNAKLLEALRGVTDRRARFVCHLCVVSTGTDGETVLCEAQGRVEGHLLDRPRGEAGFGYDPLFVPDDERAGGHTFAELPREAKQLMSHRGRALAALSEALATRGEAS